MNRQPPNSTRTDTLFPDPTFFRTRELDHAQARERADADGAEDLKGKYFGTIGAVALDAEGRIATATSTGVMTNKRWGRVGDTPLVGAGTWADERCGVSGTGWGEFFIRCAVAHDIAARVEYRGDTLQAATDDVILRVVPGLGGDGGAVALAQLGRLVISHRQSGHQGKGAARRGGLGG